MSGVELTPFGPVPLGTPYINPDTDPALVAHLIVRPDFAAAPLLASPIEPQPVYAIQRRARVEAKPIKPGTLLQAVRLRIKEIKSELKRHAALQSELSELERLLKAAKQKPIVRPLRSVG